MIEFLFQQYKDYPTHQIILELLAMLAGVLSVWFAKKNNIWVYPIGLIITSIYV
jgi:nicotinamide mononucleotide transporter